MASRHWSKTPSTSGFQMRTRALINLRREGSQGRGKCSAVASCVLQGCRNLDELMK